MRTPEGTIQITIQEKGGVTEHGRLEASDSLMLGKQAVALEGSLCEPHPKARIKID